MSVGQHVFVKSMSFDFSIGWSWGSVRESTGYRTLVKYRWKVKQIVASITCLLLSRYSGIGGMTEHQPSSPTFLSGRSSMIVVVTEKDNNNNNIKDVNWGFLLFFPTNIYCTIIHYILEISLNFRFVVNTWKVHIMISISMIEVFSQKTVSKF